MSDSTPSAAATSDPIYPATVIAPRESGIDEPDYAGDRKRPDFETADDQNFEGA